MLGILIPVGPGPRESSRLQAVLEGLARYEAPGRLSLIIVDDGPEPRRFAVDWPHVQVLRTPVWGAGRRRPDPYSAMVTGTLEGVRTAREQGLDALVKLDTDAAVIAPFADALGAAFTDRGLGVVGSYDISADGGRRDWAMWAPALARATRPITVVREGRRIGLVRRSPEVRRTIGEIRAAAYAFAPPGAHCLGGAYAVSSEFINRARLDFKPWLRTNLAEDVVVGMLSSELGLRMQSLTGPGEPFALSWRGLPKSPEQIARDRHSIVHSIRVDSESEERRLVALLRRLRDEQSAAGPAPVAGHQIGDE
jgi:hypothetical protein